jgi:hypothetical protein
MKQEKLNVKLGPQIRVLLDRLIVAQLVKKLHALYGTILPVYAHRCIDIKVFQ